jgi:hypothetical protein
MTVFAPELRHVEVPPGRVLARRAHTSQNVRLIPDFDPLVFIVAKALSVPLRELYAVLWRAGLVEIVTDGREEVSR